MARILIIVYVPNFSQNTNGSLASHRTNTRLVCTHLYMPFWCWVQIWRWIFEIPFFKVWPIWHHVVCKIARFVLFCFLFVCLFLFLFVCFCEFLLRMFEWKCIYNSRLAYVSCIFVYKLYVLLGMRCLQKKQAGKKLARIDFRKPVEQTLFQRGII